MAFRGLTRYEVARSETMQGDIDKSIKVEFKGKIKASGNARVNQFGVINGNVGQIGDVINNQQIDREKKLEALIEQLNELLEQTPAAQRDDARQLVKETEELIDTVASEKPDPTEVQGLGEGLKQTARKLGDNLPGIIEMTTKIAMAAAAIAG